MSFFDSEAVCTGYVWHKRYSPIAHGLRFKTWMSLIDLTRSDSSQLLKISGLYRLHKNDFLPREKLAKQMSGLDRGRISAKTVHEEKYSDAEIISNRVNDLLYEKYGELKIDKVFLLANVRQWFCCFNPVSFYFCLDGQGQLIAIIAEITNTPWSERHCYAFKVDDADGDGQFKLRFDKEFHVSPFHPMNIQYQWLFSFKDSAIKIQMSLFLKDKKIFDAGLKLERRSGTAKNLLFNLFKSPFQCQRTMLWIYWHALVLYMRRLPFYPHPNKLA